jgi:hypothetical protein
LLSNLLLRLGVLCGFAVFYASAVNSTLPNLKQYDLLEQNRSMFNRPTTSRRQLFAQVGTGFAGVILLPFARALAADGLKNLAPIFDVQAPISADWQKRLQHQSTRPLVELLLKAAAERLADPLPDKQFDDLLANPVYEVNVADPSIQRLVRTGLAKAAMYYYPPLFALAFQLCGEDRFHERAIQWLDVYLGWRRTDSARGDIGEAYAVMGTVLAAQWLGDLGLGEARSKSLTEAWTREGEALNRWVNVVHSNNHYWMTNAGLGFLVATHAECFERPQELLNTLVQTFRASVDKTFSEEGEYNDGLVYALKSLTATFLFAHALWERHQIQLFDHQQLRAFINFCLDTMTPDGGNLPGEHEAIRGWNWLMGRPVLSFLAATFHDEKLQSRLRGTISETDKWQRGTKLWFWFHADRPNPGNDPQSCSYWHGVFDLMWLNPEGTAEEPFQDAPRFRRYKHTGICIARNGQLGNKSMLWFRAGCASQKDMSDHNGFVWYPAGRRVLDAPRSNLDAWRDDTVNYFKDWHEFFGSSRSANVILVNGAGQQSPHPEGWPGQGGAGICPTRSPRRRCR